MIFNRRHDRPEPSSKMSRIKTVSSVVNGCPNVLWNPEHIAIDDSSHVSIYKFFDPTRGDHERVIIRVVISDGRKGSAVYWDVVPSELEDEVYQVRGNVVRFIVHLLKTTPSSKTNRAYGIQALLIWLSNINGRRNLALYPSFKLTIENPNFCKVNELVDHEELLSSASVGSHLAKHLHVSRFESYITGSSTIKKEILLYQSSSDKFEVACGVFDERSIVPALHKKEFSSENEARYYSGVLANASTGLAQLIYALCRMGGFRGFSPSF